MLGLSELKQTRVYQEALSEGRQEGCQEGERRIQFQAVPQLLEFGLSVEQIARALGLDVEAVRQPTQNQ
jgi:predicted transposase/invertase (TIGR01784 family)